MSSHADNKTPISLTLANLRCPPRSPERRTTTHENILNYQRVGKSGMYVNYHIQILYSLSKYIECRLVVINRFAIRSTLEIIYH